MSEKNRTRSQEDDRHGDEGADHQDDQQSDGNPLPVPLRRTHSTQVLQRDGRKDSKSEGGDKYTQASSLKQRHLNYCFIITS